ncbi:MAG TPA: glycosyltransferase family 39 protein [Candidatus Binataceae bacterium]|nr:glycosyltransferase family 39 protein [Candidatus Binataceae bacterium]
MNWTAAAWGALALTAILYFARLGARALWASEFRWAEISREMLRTGNYFWPTINGHLYYDKPLGSYWLVLASMPFSGGLNETAARIPCAIAGLLAVGLLILLARRLYDLRIGVVAGFILATSFSLVFFSRCASADVETIAGELAALLLFLKHEDRPTGWWVVGFWIIMALTSLTKGLLGFVLPIMVVGLYATLSDGWALFGANILRGPLAQRIAWLIDRNRWLFNWRSLLAIPLGLAIYVAPFRISRATMGSSAGLNMVFRENVVRFFEPFDHRGAIYLYVYIIFELMAPWALLLPAALVQAHHQRRIDAGPAKSDRFALIFFWSTFAFFTLSGSRRSYYILPILPAAAMILARMLTSPAEELSAWARRLMNLGFAIFVAAVIAGVVLLIPPDAILRGELAKLPPAPDRLVFAMLWLPAIATVIYALRNYSVERVAIAMSVGAYAAMIYIYLFALPAAEAWRGEKPFGVAIRAAVADRTDLLGLFRTVGPLFYIDPPKPLAEFDKPKDLGNAVSAGKIAWVIVRRRDLPAMGVGGDIVVAESSYPWESDYEYRNKVVLVRLNPNGSR